jgi:hypothetical protein
MESQPGFFRRRRFWIGLVLVLLAAWFYDSFQVEIRQLFFTAKGFYDLVLLRPNAAIPPWGDILRALLVLGFCFLAGYLLAFNLTLHALLTFILPVRTRRERRESFNRLLAHLSNRDAPAIFVRDGTTDASQDELESTEPGIVLVNVNSAITLERKFRAAGRKPENVEKRTRVCAPGIVFTESNETVTGMVDLRPQARSKTGVRGYTLDGIEIQTNISAAFTLGQPPEVILVSYAGEPAYKFWVVLLQARSSDSPRVVRLVDELNETECNQIFTFQRRLAGLGAWIAPPPEIDLKVPRALKPEFNRERAFKAIYSQALDPHGTISRWSDLPVEVAANVFRDLLSREKYDSLYELNEQRHTRLEELQEKFKRVMQLEGERSFQLVARLDGNPLEDGQPWIEAEMVRYPTQAFTSGRFLRDCGIKVGSAGFSEPVPVDPQILQQRLDNWRAYWERQTKIDRAEQEYQASQILTNARSQRQAEMVRSLSKILNNKAYTSEAIAIQLFQTLDDAARDPATRRLLPQEVVEILDHLQPYLLPEEKSESGDEGSRVR